MSQVGGPPIIGARGGGIGIHNILSPEHLDTLEAAIAAGDILTVSALLQWGRLPAGNVGDVLTMGAAVPAWAASVAGGGDACLTVAAADTPAILRGRADYVGDGTAGMGDVPGDEAEINTALGIADTVILCPGTFWVNNPINLGTGQSLIGSGAGTVIKIRDSINKDLHVITANSVNRILVSNLRLDGNRTNRVGGWHRGIDLTSVTLSKFIDCWLEEFYGYGLYTTTASENLIARNHCRNNQQEQIRLTSTSDYNIVANNRCEIANNHAILLDASSRNVIVGNILEPMRRGICLLPGSDRNVIKDNVIRDLGENGIWLQGSYNIIIGNLIEKTSMEGIELYGAHYNLIVGNTFLDNSQAAAGGTYDNIYLNGTSTHNLIKDNIMRVTISDLVRYGIAEASDADDYNTVEGNQIELGGVTSGLLNIQGVHSRVKDNYDQEITDDRVLILVKNTSGGALAAGDTVIHKAVAAGNEVDTTNVQGHDKVFGMAVEAINNNEYGLVLVQGKTAALKVNGTAAIAIGDLLGTYTAAGIAMQAAAGDMAFAIALEAYAVADSNGVIDALLIKPRKV